MKIIRELNPNMLIKNINNIKWLKRKIVVYECRFVQRWYEGNWSAMIESFYFIWFIKFLIGKPCGQPELWHKLLGKPSKKRYERALNLLKRDLAPTWREIVEFDENGRSHT